MARPEAGSFRERVGEGMEVGGLVGAAIGLLVSGELVAFGIASALVGVYLRRS